MGHHIHIMYYRGFPTTAIRTYHAGTRVPTTAVQVDTGTGTCTGRRDFAALAISTGPEYGYPYV
jgi:hypothetical protein